LGAAAWADPPREAMRHWIMTTSSWPGVPSQRMSPLRSAAWVLTRSSFTNRPCGAFVS
jgi:hypothetical protein